jgi:hypothetical protein
MGWDVICILPVNAVHISNTKKVNTYLVYPNFGLKNTRSKCSSISDIYLLLLRDCQFDIVHPDISPAHFYSLCSKTSSIMTLSMFSCISSHLKLSLINCMFLCIFMSRLFAKIHEKGYFSHFPFKLILVLENGLKVFPICLYKLLF